jgi:glycosyltransferase involved in cell wall biosynthesis
MEPLVSFIVAARDAEDTIESALRSLQWQTFAHWEAIVVDDGSSDETARRVQLLREPRIQLVELGEQRGRSVARNAALSLARGRYIAIQDADDMSHPRRLEILLDLVAADPTCGVASGQHADFDHEDVFRATTRWPTDADEIRAGLLRGRMTVCHGASLIDTQLMRGLGGYDEVCVRAQDLNLFMRAARVTRFAVSDRIVLYYRHPRVVPLGYWLESNRYRTLAVRRARTGLPPADLNGRCTQPPIGWWGRALLSYLRHATLQRLDGAIAIPGPEPGVEAPINPRSA